MSTNVWKIGQEVSADKYFETSRYITYATEGEGDDAKVIIQGGFFFGGGRVAAANKMAEICNEMAAEYATAVEDANNYILEIDSSIDELNDLQENVKEQIAKLEKEIAELNEKKENGTITEEEQAELDSKQEQLNSLTSSSNTQIDTMTGDINTRTGKANELISEEKEKIATDYGSTAVSKGDELAQTKDKRKSFFRKIFGGWDKSEIREAGTKLSGAGENLLENVTDGQLAKQEITKRQKNLSNSSV